MASQTIDIEIRAKTEQLIAEIQKAGKVSDKSARAMANAIVKSATEAEKAQAKAAATTEKHWTAAAKKVGSALGEGVIPKFEKLSGLGESLGGIMGASALQVAALTTGIGALAAGAIYLNTTIGTTVANLDDEVAAVSEVQRVMSASAIDAIRPYAEAHKQASDAVAGMKFELAALTGTFDKTDDMFYTGAEFVLHFLRTGEGMEEWRRKTEAAIRGAGRTIKQFSTDQLAEALGMPGGAKASTPAVQKAASTTGGKSSPRVKSAKDEAAELDALYRDLATGLESYEADKALAAEAAEERRVEAVRAANEKIADDRRRALAQDLADQREHEQQVQALIDRRTQSIADATGQTLAGIGSLVQAVGDLVVSVYDQQAESARDGSKQEREARMKSFKAAKAAAIAQAAINTALGVTQALTGPFPLNYINAALVTAAGAVQIGLIASKQPPQMHTGGMVAAPDEVDTRLQSREAILSRTGVEAVGGADGVARANRGEPIGGGAVVVVQTYEHRSFGAFMGHELRRPGGALREAIRGGRLAGIRGT